MADKGRNYSIAFAIAAKLASNFGNTFGNATKAVNGLANSMLAVAGIDMSLDGFQDIVGKYAEFEQAMANLRTQSGMTEKELSSVSDSAKNLFANNYGTDINDIAQSMANIKQQTKLTGKELEDFTKNSIVFRDTFEFATEESTRAVNQMVKALGTSSEEAFNLLAQGAQNGLNANGDLMDWVNEYSVHFSQMGFSAEEMFNMVANGADSGVFQVEKLGDAIKEFGIRSKDSSNGTLEAFKALGLNANKITSDFAMGGQTAKLAFEQVTNKLFAMSDQVAQDQVGVALFGTMWEDLGKNGIKALSNINGEFDATKSTMNEIDGIKYSTLQGVWDGILRKIDMIKIQLGEMIGPEIKSFLEVVSNNIPIAFDKVCSVATNFKNIVVNTFNNLRDRVMENQPLLDALSGLVNDINDRFNYLKQAFTDAFGSPKEILDNLSTNILPAVADGIMFVVQKAVELYNFISSNWNTIEPIVLGIAAAFATYKLSIMAVQAKTIICTNVTKYMALAQAKLNAIMNLNPYAKVALIIGAVVAAGIYLYKNWDTIKAKAIEVWNGIKGVFGGIGAWFQEKWNSVLQTTQNIWNNVAGFLGSFPIGQALLQNITNMIEAAKQIFGGIIDFVKNVFTGNWQGAWQAVIDIFKGMFDMLVGFAKAPINAIIGIINTVIQSINKVGFTIPDWVPVVGGQAFKINIPEMPMFYKGSTGFNTPDTFLAGERGPEIVTNAKGYRVFNNRDTNGMIGKRFGSGISEASGPMNNVEVIFNPQISISGASNVSAQDILDELIKYEPLLIKKIIQAIQSKSNNDRRLSYVSN
ncbi:phage tail tape measure protein [Cellulosilyticum sp. WCF-2]|uniref:phage tail tape measure protein n=1 Tax=Cellulosilyticum sp. WCF-2 TaxID=2497860 RepID=UPI000F8F7B94|nr:phage tail tape measure protein [Cellulosilyticum sp. WCF-2]QEH67261.1 hypothetical protein EKH84_01950 [Cellulosilyticum sp. WCF-2]